MHAGSRATASTPPGHHAVLFPPSLPLASKFPRTPGSACPALQPRSPSAMVGKAACTHALVPECPHGDAVLPHKAPHGAAIALHAWLGEQGAASPVSVLDPRSPPCQGLTLFAGSQVTSFFMVRSQKRSRGQGRRGALAPRSETTTPLSLGWPPCWPRPASRRPSHTRPRGFGTTLHLLPAKRQQWLRARGAVSHSGGSVRGVLCDGKQSGALEPRGCPAGPGGTGEAPPLREGGEGGTTSSPHTPAPWRPKPNTALPRSPAHKRLPLRWEKGRSACLAPGQSLVLRIKK
jgi:hypothetical protein